MSYRLVQELAFWPYEPRDVFDIDAMELDVIVVAWRGPSTDVYAVTRRGFCWNGSEWEFEPLPSGRDDEFIARTRFTFDRACGIAESLVPAADGANR
jgi:hypothetical protein